MPAELAMVVHHSGTALVPADSTQADALQRLRDAGLRGRVHVSIKQPRHPGAHRKLFALLQHLYQHWEPEEIGPDVPPQRSFAAFRSHILILAGHYRQVWRLDGTFLLEPLSMAFAEMDQVDLDDLFGRVIDVGLARIPAFHGRRREDVELDMERIMAFVR